MKKKTPRPEPPTASSPLKPSKPLCELMDLFGTDAAPVAIPEHDLLIAIVRRALNDLWHKKPSVREAAREYFAYSEEDYDSQEGQPLLKAGPWGSLSHCCVVCEGGTAARTHMRRVLDLARVMVEEKKKLAAALRPVAH